MRHEAPLLRIDAVSKTYAGAGGALSWLLPAAQPPAAVDGVSFDVHRGETFGLVGESGSGKSTIAKLAVGLTAPTAGAVWFDGFNLASLRTRRQQAPVRRRIQMIFQDPGGSLNPRWRVRDIIAEPIRTHTLRTRGAQTRRRVDELLERVGLSAADGDRFPHAFSGGQRQRISLARALASESDLIVCDEPTSALDVSIQAQVLNILMDLQRTLGLTYLFISHNLPVVGFMSRRVGVMYQGRLVECGSSHRLIRSPRHPYTRALLDTVLDLKTGRAGQRSASTTEDAEPTQWSHGCAFAPRCSNAMDECRAKPPPMVRDGEDFVACHRPL
jgi:peptide/nickel transport system ATP-binding protein